MLVCLLAVTHSLQILLRDKQTCFSFFADAKDEQREIYYNYDVGVHRIHLDVRNTATGALLNTSRNIGNRNHYLKVTTLNAGEHDMCFEKESSEEQLLHFDIIDERYFDAHIAGKEEVLKILSSGRRLLQHLEKVNINQKSMLMEHHRRTDELKQVGRETHSGLLIKLAVVVVVLVGQFLAVRQLFK